MAFARYKNKKTGRIEFAFEGEEDRLIDDPSMYEKLWPNPQTVTALVGYMVDFQLESIHTSYELDRQLNIEASEESEMKHYQKHRQNA